MAGSITAGGNISIINNAPYNLSAGLLVFQGTSGTTDFNVGSSSSVTTLFQGTNNIYINNGISGTGVTRLTGSGNVVVDMTGSAALVLTQTGSVYNNYTGATTVRGEN